MKHVTPVHRDGTEVEWFELINWDAEPYRTAFTKLPEETKSKILSAKAKYSGTNIKIQLGNKQKTVRYESAPLIDSVVDTGKKIYKRALTSIKQGMARDEKRINDYYRQANQAEQQAELPVEEVKKRVRYHASQ